LTAPQNPFRPKQKHYTELYLFTVVVTGVTHNG